MMPHEGFMIFFIYLLLASPATNVLILSLKKTSQQTNP